jgi:modulator of FtsH protease HflK
MRRGRGLFGLGGSDQVPPDGNSLELTMQDPWWFRITVFRAAAVLLVLWAAISCGYCVSNGHNSVVQRFGKHVRTEGPGVSIKLPWPIETATIINVGEVSRIEVGFRTVSAGKYEDKREEQEMLTADTNIVELDFVVQFRKTDAAKWLYSAEDPEEAIRLMAQSAMRTVVGGSSFDQVATSGRATIQESTHKITQELVNGLDIGVTIVAVQLQDAQPPEKVIPSFQDVNNAKEDKQTKIQHAEAYRKQQIPYARGQAKKITEESQAYKTERIAQARGEADRFSQVLTRYQQAPQLTLDRMRMESIQSIITGKPQFVDLTDGGMLKYFNMQSFGPVAAPVASKEKK